MNCKTSDCDKVSPFHQLSNRVNYSLLHLHLLPPDTGKNLMQYIASSDALLLLPSGENMQINNSYNTSAVSRFSVLNMNK